MSSPLRSLPPNVIKRIIRTDGTIEEQELEDYEEDVREAPMVAEDWNS